MVALGPVREVKGLYTTTEVAEIFKVSAKTVKRWVANGELKAIKTPGGHYRFTEAAVNKLKKEK
jgi:excisionase family DNA binding protein